MASSLRPSLNKKKSGSFWRRKGSLGMQHGREGEHEGATLSTGVNGNTVVEGGADRSQLNVQKRKSSAFWRRKSSLGLADAFGGADGGTGVGLNGETNGTVNGAQNGMTNGRHFGDEDVVLRGMDTEKQLPGIAQPLSPPLRSWSPPPQIPELFGGGGELGGEDLFKDIH